MISVVEHTELKRVGAVSAIYLPSIARKPDGTGWYILVEVENVLPGRRAFPAPAATGWDASVSACLD